MRFAIEFISSSMNPASIRIKFVKSLHASAVLLVISSFVVSFAQSPADTRSAKLALAGKEALAAIELSRKTDEASWGKAIQKLQRAEAIYSELGDKEKLLPTVML